MRTILIFLFISAPRTNPNVPSMKSSVSAMNTPSQSVSVTPVKQTRPATPELPTVPCPMVTSTHDSLLEEAFQCEAEDSVLEEEIRENSKMMSEAIMKMVSTISESVQDEKDEELELPDTLLSEDNTEFIIVKSSSPQFINIHFIGETASRILFSTVYWLRQLPYFASLHLNNQIKLLSRCWLDLFVLGLAQRQDSVHLDQILESVADNMKNMEDAERPSLIRVRQVTHNIIKLKEYVTGLNKLQLTETEFGLLKLICVFNSDPASVNSDYYEKISDTALSELRDQPKNQSEGSETRYSKLLLRLSPLRSLQDDVFEEVFFGGLIGSVQIETVIPILLKMEHSELQQYLTSQN